MNGAKKLLMKNMENWLKSYRGFKFYYKNEIQNTGISMEKRAKRERNVILNERNISRRNEN